MMINRGYRCRKCLTHGRKEFIEHIRVRNNRLTSSFISADEMINPNPSFSHICHMIVPYKSRLLVTVKTVFGRIKFYGRFNLGVLTILKNYLNPNLV